MGAMPRGLAPFFCPSFKLDLKRKKMTSCPMPSLRLAWSLSAALAFLIIWRAQADAAAKAGEKGGAADSAIDVGPGVELYQLTENGLALQATIQGTKYWKDDELNTDK